jgi:predicted RNA-binding protein with RPS1 domain
VGQKVDLVYRAGRFVPKNCIKTFHEFGSLVVVRAVKNVPGYGVTVQLDEKTFGLIELSEITDEISSGHSLFSQAVFLARIIGADKKGRLQLSSRESVTDNEMW